MYLPCMYFYKSDEKEVGKCFVFFCVNKFTIFNNREIIRFTTTTKTKKTNAKILLKPSFAVTV